MLSVYKKLLNRIKALENKLKYNANWSTTHAVSYKVGASKIVIFKWETSAAMYYIADATINLIVKNGTNNISYTQDTTNKVYNFTLSNTRSI